MEGIIELIAKAGTRYIIPGLAFVIFIVWLPLTLFLPDLIKVIDLLNPFLLIALCIIFGYLLDAIGSYSWTLSFKKYRKEKDKLVVRAQEIYPTIKSTDPDHYLTEIWLRDPKLYDRIFLERSEWVMILEVSLTLFLGSLVIFVMTIIFYFRRNNIEWFSILIAIIMILFSYLASRKGIQRMIVHDEKVIGAIGDLKNKGRMNSEILEKNSNIPD